MWKWKQTESYYFSPYPEQLQMFSSAFQRQIEAAQKQGMDLVFLCIGSERVMGDRLGPLVGSQLQEAGISFPCYGTLSEPIHALHFPEIVWKLEEIYPHAYFVVVDAAVGARERIGMISLRCEAMQPGLGAGKWIAPVGRLSITGIVAEAMPGIETYLPYIRKEFVEKLAMFISTGIIEGVSMRGQTSSFL